MLIDIHSQHEVLSLKTPEFRTRFLDACADGGKQFQTFAKQYTDWKTLKSKAEKLKECLNKATADQDYLQFQLDELLKVNLIEGELSQAQERLSLLENAEEISTTISNIGEALNGMEGGLLDVLRQVDSELRSLSSGFQRQGMARPNSL